MHPFALTARCDDSHAAQIRKMPGNLGLALAEYLDEVADTDFPSIHEVEEPQAGAVGERGKEQGEIVGFRGTLHGPIICALTYMYSNGYIRLHAYEETRKWIPRQTCRSR